MSPGRLPGWRLCLVWLVVLLTAGCQGVAGRAEVAETAELGRWLAPDAPVYRAANLVVAGATVEHFPEHAALTSWVHSQELLVTAARRWLGVPAARTATVVDPDREAFRRFLATDVAERVGPGDTLLFYLGTHQLKDGRILLGNGESTRPAELAAWLAAVPAGHIVLLGDFCYGEQAEAAVWAPAITRIYASSAGERAPDIDLDGLNAVRATFGATRAIIRHDLQLDHRRYSLLGLMTVHALRQEMEMAPRELTWPALFTRMRDDTRRLDDDVRRFAVPDLAARNLSWLLLAQLQAPEPASPAANSLDQLQKLPDADIDPALANLLVGQLFDPKADPAPHLARVDEMAGVLRERIGAERRADRVVALINAYLYGELKLEAVAAPYPTDFLLGELLATGRGRCTSLTTLYLALGRRLGIPFRAICIPEHVYVRWVPQQGDGWVLPGGAGFLNVETTMAGKSLPESDYERQYGWPNTALSRQFYRQPLTNHQLIGIFYSPLSHALLVAGRGEEAAKAAREAVAINAADPEAWNNLGMARRRQEQPALAMGCYRRALQINPRFAEAWNNLGTVESDPATRLTCYQNATGLKPDLAEAWKNLALLYFQQGEFRKAMDCAETCNKLNAPMPKDFVDAVERRL